MSPSRSEVEARKGILTVHILFHHKFQIAFACNIPQGSGSSLDKNLVSLFLFFRFICTIPTCTTSNFPPPGLVSSYASQPTVAPLCPHVLCWQHPYSTAPIYTLAWPAWLSHGLSYSRRNSVVQVQKCMPATLLFLKALLCTIFTAGGRQIGAMQV